MRGESHFSQSFLWCFVYGQPQILALSWFTALVTILMKVCTKTKDLNTFLFSSPSLTPDALNSKELDDILTDFSPSKFFASQKSQEDLKLATIVSSPGKNIGQDDSKKPFDLSHSSVSHVTGDAQTSHIENADDMAVKVVTAHEHDDSLVQNEQEENGSEELRHDKVVDETNTPGEKRSLTSRRRNRNSEQQAQDIQSNEQVEPVEVSVVKMKETNSNSELVKDTKSQSSITKYFFGQPRNNNVISPHANDGKESDTALKIQNAKSEEEQKQDGINMMRNRETEEDKREGDKLVQEDENFVLVEKSVLNDNGVGAKRRKSVGSKKDNPIQERVLNAYQLFCKKERDAIDAKEGLCPTFAELQKLFSEKWKTLSEEAKKPFYDEAEHAKRRILEEQQLREKNRVEEQKRKREEKKEKEREEKLRRIEEWERRDEEKMRGKKIIDGLYLGNRHVAKNRNWMLEVNCTHVLNVSSEVKNYFQVNS